MACISTIRLAKVVTPTPETKERGGRGASSARFPRHQNQRLVLVVSSEDDDHARAVLSRLSEKGTRAELLDLSRYPQRASLTLSYGRDGAHRFGLRRSDSGEEIPLSACGAVWWRRPQPVELHPEITRTTHRAFAHSEIHEALAGLWLAMDATWINHLTRDEEASHKPYQLRVAQEVGLQIPATCITSDPQEASAFIDQWGLERTIYKAFTATAHDWRETRLLKPDELNQLDNVRFAPVIFQEYIPLQLDLRITIVGDSIFAAAVDSSGLTYRIDYRMELGNAQVSPFQLPAPVVERLYALMDRLGLVYGAIDMRLTPEDQFVFLEINPTGQWLFIEERTGQPITEAFAQLLASCSAT